MRTSELQPDVAAALVPERVGAGLVMRLGTPAPARVKIAIPVRNGEATLERALASALAQEGVDVQVIVVDNASTDATFSIAAAYASRDPRVVLYRNPRDIGRVGNWNRCLDVMRECVYAKLLMASDELLPEFAAATSALLDQHPSAVLLRTSLTMQHADGRVEFHPRFGADTLVEGREARRLSLSGGSLAANPTGQLWRMAALDGLRFDETLSWASDYDFAMRLFERGDFAYRRAQLYVFHTDAHGFHNASTGARRLADECEIVARYGDVESMPFLERYARDLGGGSELESILARTRTRLARPRLDVRATSFLLPLDHGWEAVVERYLRAFAADDDVTLVLKPRPDADLDTVVAALADLAEADADLLLDVSDAPLATLAAQVDRVLHPGDRDDPRLFDGLPRAAGRC